MASGDPMVLETKEFKKATTNNESKIRTWNKQTRRSTRQGDWIKKLYKICANNNKQSELIQKIVEILEMNVVAEAWPLPHLFCPAPPTKQILNFTGTETNTLKYSYETSGRALRISKAN